MSTWLDKVEEIVKSNGDLGLCVGGSKNETDKSKENLHKRLNKVEKTIHLLNEQNNENEESDDEESDGEESDGEGSDGEESDDEGSDDEELRCIFWNCGGLLSKLESSTIFLKLVISGCPDLIFLNEIKCQDVVVDDDDDDRVIENLADKLGYKCIYTPSIEDQGRSKRGSAILYRKEAYGKFKFVSNSDESISEADMEAISGTFKFGDANHKMICVYVAPSPNKAKKDKLIKYLKKFKTSRMIAVGDFNLEKRNSNDLQNETGFEDVLDPYLPTYYWSGTETSIDYIMKKGITEEIKYRCFPPKNPENGHAMFAFSVPRPPSASTS